MTFDSNRYTINDYNVSTGIPIRTVTVRINRDQFLQTVAGFGNAFTDAVTINLDAAPTLATNIFKSYFSNTVGNGFNILRIPIGGTDFGASAWAYNEFPLSDENLSNFTTLDDRDVVRNEYIAELLSVTENPNILFFGSAWTPPRWMKSNNAWSGISHLLPKYYQTWADYHVKYLELQAAAGINYWAITTGNEPSLATFPAGLVTKIPSVGWTGRTQGQWVAENLGPTLANSTVNSTKIFAGDDQRNLFPSWFESMYSAYPDAKNYVYAHAVHWYQNTLYSPSLLNRTHHAFPDHPIYGTEACTGAGFFDDHIPKLGDWSRGELYIQDIIQDFNHWVSAWVDWNMILDPSGGPTWINNNVDSPIIVNTTSMQLSPNQISSKLS